MGNNHPIPTLHFSCFAWVKPCSAQGLPLTALRDHSWQFWGPCGMLGQFTCLRTNHPPSSQCPSIPGNSFPLPPVAFDPSSRILLPPSPPGALLPSCSPLSLQFSVLPIETCFLQVNKISDYGKREVGRGPGLLSSVALNVAGCTEAGRLSFQG